MNKKFIVFFLATLVLVGCSSSNNTSKTADTAIIETSSVQENNLDELKNIFEQNGYTFSFESVDKNILEGERFNVTLNNQSNLQVFVYESKESADIDAGRISTDGFSYTKAEGSNNTTSSMEWKDSPHFYKYNNYVILYLGNDKELLELMESTFGNQIAGE